MAIEHCDDFTFYGGNVALLLNGIYSSFGVGGGAPALINDPDGISSGKVISPSQTKSGSAYSQNLRYALAEAQDIVGISNRIWLTGMPIDALSYPVFASFADASNNRIVDIAINPIGGFTIYNTVAGEQYQTSGPTISANAWWHIETKIEVSTGSLEIRVEGTVVYTTTGKNFGANPVAQFAYATVRTGLAQLWAFFDYYKDLVIWNGSGTQNNNFLGPVIVEELTPTADIALNWTPVGAGTGFSILDDAPPQDTLKYLDAPYPSIPSPYVCDLSDLPANTTNVLALMTLVRAAKVDGGLGKLQVGLISSPSSAPVTGLGTDREITTAQTYWRDVQEVDPKTGLAWVPSAVNVVQLQLNRTT